MSRPAQFFSSRGGRLLALGVLGVLTSLVAERIAYQQQSTIQLDFDDDPPAFVTRGFYEVERAPDGLTFAWTGPVFGLALRGLDRRVPWTVTIRMRGARVDRSTPAIRAAIDGAAIPERPLAAEFSEYTFDAAPTGARGDVHFNAAIAPTVVASPTDRRVLGAQVDWIRIAPSGRPAMPAAFTSTAWLTVVVAIVAGAAAVPIVVAASIVVLFAIVAAIVTTAGLAPVLGIPVALLLAAGIVAGAGAAAAATFGRSEHRSAAIIGLVTMTAVTLKLMVLFHPAMPIGDALFQAHRFQDVLGGHYLFTSLAPGGYQFPYAIGLYLAARPLAVLTHSPIERIALLRMVVVLVEATLVGCLYRFVMAWRNDRATGVATVAAYHLIPLGFNVVVTGNLTNAFSQALALPVLPLLAAGAIWPAAGVATLGFLSHTGTLAILSGQLFVTGLWFLRSPNASTRRTGLTILLATTAAILVAFVVYYGHFFDVYRGALARAAQETGERTSAGGRTPLVRLEDVPRMLVFCYGWPMLVLGAVGLMVLARSSAGTNRARTVFLTWLAACACFVVLGIVTPIDFRHYLAAVPLLAILAALALERAWTGGWWLRAAACLVAGWTMWAAFSDWVAPILR